MTRPGCRGPHIDTSSRPQPTGYLHRLDAELVGRASMLLGAGRAKAGDTSIWPRGS